MRAVHEIAHGHALSMGDPERIWGWTTAAGRLRAQRRAEMIAAGAHLTPGMRVLEVGCGTGMFTEIFARRGIRIVAVDISPDLIEKAQARHLPSEQVTFMAKPLEQCEGDSTFDAVIGSSVLHHLEIEVAIAKIFQLLRPGGRMSFAEPNMLNPQVFLERKLKFLPLFSYISPDESAFVRWTLNKMLLKAGFEDVGITPFDWLHPTTPENFIPLLRRIGNWLEMTAVLREFSGSLCIRGRRSF